MAAAASLVLVPAAAYYLWAWHVSITYPPHHFTGGGKFLWSADLSVWIAKNFFLGDLLAFVAGPGYAWGVPVLVLATLGLLLPLPAVAGRGAPWLFHAWALAMVVRLAIEAEHLVTDPNNLLLCNPMVAALAGSALVYVARSPRLVVSQTTRWGLAVALILLLAIDGQVRTHDQFADPYRDHMVLGRALSEMSRSDDLVISMGIEPVVLYHSSRNGWLFPPSDSWASSDGGGDSAWDYGEADVALLDGLVGRGARWLVIPSWNSYLAGDRETLQRKFPVLFAGIEARFEAAREMPEGLILRAR